MSGTSATRWSRACASSSSTTTSIGLTVGNCGRLSQVRPCQSIARSYLLKDVASEDVTNAVHGEEQKGLAIRDGLSRVVEREDAGMLQSRRDLDLAQEG